ncbi:hypothetical protein [Geodermatophilus sp. SYSU D01105]
MRTRLRRLLSVLALTVAASVVSIPGAQAASASWGQWHSVAISASAPKATYTYVLRSAATARFVLGDLGADYALTLFDGSWRTVATSNRAGRNAEEIIRPLKAGTYHAVVTSPAKKYTSARFSVRGQVISGVALLSSSGRVLPDGRFLLAADLYNTTSVPQDWRADLKFYDRNGGFLESRQLDDWSGAVMPRSHGFAGAGLANWYVNPPPRGWTSYRITNVRAWPKECSPTAKMPVTRFAARTDPANSGRTIWSGLVGNRDRRMHTAQIAIANFNARADILTATGNYRGSVVGGEAVSWSFGDYRVSGATTLTLITAQAYSSGCW